MPLTTKEVKARLKEKAKTRYTSGTLDDAAQKMSNREYRFNGDQLSKVLRGERNIPIIRFRVAKFLGLPIEEVFPELHKPATNEQAYEAGL